MLKVWGICLKSYEKEAFLKSFSLFFFVQFTFLSLVMWQYHKSVSHKYEMKIMHEIRQCSYTLDCVKYDMNFIEHLNGRELNTLYSSDEYYMLFAITSSKNHYIKLSLSKEKYNIEYNKIFNENLKIYLFFLLIVLLISIFFASFALRPLREALRLNDELVKDMLHDFNTPLSSLKINFKILEKKFGVDAAIMRSNEAMQTISDLQLNLSYYLAHSPLLKEKIELSSFVKRRVEHYEMIFSDINFSVDIAKVYVDVNPEALMRIVDNLLSNASKYNVRNGTVKVYFIDKRLIIEDSGIGIKKPLKVFNRFYKETERGMGIGLHVVQKLCEDLGIEIKVESEVGVGSKFILKFLKSNV